MAPYVLPWLDLMSGRKIREIDALFALRVTDACIIGMIDEFFFVACGIVSYDIGFFLQIKTLKHY